MSTYLNDLFYDGIEVIVDKDGKDWRVDVRYNRDDGKYEDGEYLAGYNGIDTEDNAEFLARAFIAGYKLAKGGE